MGVVRGMTAGTGIGLCAGLVGLSLAADPGKLPGKLPAPPVVQEAPKTVPKQKLQLALMRITRIKPDCLEGGNPVRIVGRGFGSNRGARQVRIGNQPIVIREWADERIDGTVPGGLTAGHGYTVSVVDDRGDTLARSRTTACTKKNVTAVQKTVAPPPMESAPRVGVPAPTDAGLPPQSPPGAHAKSLPEAMNAQRPTTQVELGRLPTPQPLAATPPPLGQLELPTPALPPVQPPGIPTPAPTPQKHLGVAVAPRTVEPLEHQPSPFGHAANRMKQQTTRSVSLPLVGGAELRINGIIGPNVAVVPGNAVNLGWNMVTQSGERVDRLWLVVRESPLPANVCEGDPEHSYSEIPTIRGDGALNPPAVTGTGALSGLTAATYYLRLCVRTDLPGEGRAWRGASNPITLTYRAVPEVEQLIGETFVIRPRGTTEPAEDLPDLRIDRVEVLTSGSGQGHVWFAVSNHASASDGGVLPAGSFEWEIVNRSRGDGLCASDFTSQRGRSDISQRLGGAWILTDMQVARGRYCLIEITFNQTGGAVVYPERNYGNNAYRTEVGYGRPPVDAYPGTPGWAADHPDRAYQWVDRVSIAEQGPSWVIVHVEYSLRPEIQETVRGPYRPAAVPNSIRVLFKLNDGTWASRGQILCHGQSRLYAGENRRVSYLCQRMLQGDSTRTLETVALGACFDMAFGDCRPQIPLRKLWVPANHGTFSFRLRSGAPDDRPPLSDLTAEIVGMSLQDEPRTIRFVVRNEGTLIARNIRYRVRIGPRNQPGREIGTGGITRLEPGAATEQSFYIPRTVSLLETAASRSPPYANRVYVDIDPNDQILEWIEGNNTAMGGIPYELGGSSGNGGLRSGSTL